MLTQSEIQIELAQRIADILSMEVCSVDVEAPLHTLGLDSMRMVEMLVFIEKKYSVDLMASGLSREDVSSISALARSVETRQTP